MEGSFLGVFDVFDDFLFELIVELSDGEILALIGLQGSQLLLQGHRLLFLGR
jgi:hypothetical protein